jgi:hypothetical protein
MGTTATLVFGGFLQLLVANAGKVARSDHDRFLPHPFSSLFTNHPAGPHTDSAVKRATNGMWG